MLGHPRVQALMATLEDWPQPPLKRHNDAGHPLHVLTFLADIGLCADDSGMAPTVARILAHRSAQGPMQSLLEVAVAFGGTGVAQPLWALCDAPSIAYALVKLGRGQDERVQTAVTYMAGLLRENGWPCVASPELGTFHGPGRRSDPCPYATLLMVKLLAQMPEWRNSPAAHVGAESLLSLWQARKERKPYLFGMGTDFAKLKAPLIWYDIVHVLDALTQFEWLRGDARLHEMLALLRSKADGDDRYTPQSVYRAWADWDFGQKRQPSPWLTLLVHKILQRAAFV
jgi:hypothetical protein